MSDSNNRDNRVLYILAGILIPLLAIVVPYAISWLQNLGGLEYEYTGPVDVGDMKAFSITLSNTGDEVEKNIEIWLPDEFEDEEKVEIDSDIPVKTKVVQNSSLLIIDALRPKENVEISVLLNEPYFRLWKHHMDSIRIVSDQSLASLSSYSDEEIFFYQIGFWAFIIIMMVVLIAGIYDTAAKRK